MEALLAFILKLATVFIGSCFLTLFFYYIVVEVSKVPKLIFEGEKQKLLEKGIKIKQRTSISSKSGYYKITMASGNQLVVFSSHEGIKILE